MPTPSILILPRRVNNSWTVGLTEAEVSPSVFTPHQILYSPSLMWWFWYFSLMILSFAICSSVIGLHPVLKRACPSEKIRPSHVFMNRAINISLNSSWLPRGFGLNVRRRLYAARTTHVHRWLEKLRHLASVRLTCMQSVRVLSLRRKRHSLGITKIMLASVSEAMRIQYDTFWGEQPLRKNHE